MKLFSRLRPLLLSLAAVAALLVFLWALSGAGSSSTEKSIRQLEEALRRAAAACYATEGIYPPDVDYLRERYGVLADEEKYIIMYEAVGSNLMPEITVLERK